MLTGWLEPLADRVADNWHNVPMPVIEMIHDDTFFYSTTKSAKSVFVGGFSWDLIFHWHPPPNDDMKDRTSNIAPIRFLC